MQRHDLLRIDPEAWEEMLRGHPSLVTIPLVADWAVRGWPVIVRRRMVGDLPEDVPAAVPLPPSYGKHRVGFSFRSDKVAVPLPPVQLSDAVSGAPKPWQQTIAGLLALGAAIGVAPRVFGGLLWQHVTGLAYLSPQSDLDLLWPVADQHTGTALLAGLRRLDADSPVRLDGELILPDGGGVNWRELALASDGTSGEVLVKTMDGVATKPVADLFVPAVLP
jgi:phosphoribosyl-dephospho-CoA transferase